MNRIGSSIKWHIWLLSFGIFLIVPLVFSQTASFDFINFDDDIYVVNNPHVNTGLSWANIQWAFSTTHGGHWHPVTWLSHMVDCEIFGLNPGAHHLENVLLHAISSVLVFLLFLRCTNQLSLSFVLASIFAVHPLRLESVAWVSERKDVLSILFGLLSLHLYLSFVSERELLFRRGYYIGSFLLLAVGLLSKPSLIVIPVLMVLLDFWPTARLKEKQKLVIDKLPFFLLALGFACIVLFAQEQEGGLKQLSLYPLESRIAAALVGFLAYAGKLFFPTGMGIFYPFLDYPPGVASGAAFGLIIVTIVCVQHRSNHPYLLFGWLWFLVSAAPIIGLVQVGGQAFADRWSYLPHIGFLLGIGSYLESVTRQYNLLLLRKMFFLLPLLYGAITVSQLPNWKNTEAVFRHAIQLTPDNFLAHMNLAVELDNGGSAREAEFHYQRAVTLRPQYVLALDNLGSFYARQGEYKKAISYFERALAIAPGSVDARYHLGLAYAKSGSVVYAATEWVRVLSFEPENERANSSLQELALSAFAAPCEALAPIGLNRRSLVELRTVLEAWKWKKEQEQVFRTLFLAAECFLRRD
ncbi:MAG: tetratricopeptide repeat protein [Bdellovibrionales bacterium]|nr:tetratricopeptide repeat protein [Bdellovibrionales bacterium]